MSSLSERTVVIPQDLASALESFKSQEVPLHVLVINILEAHVEANPYFKAQLDVGGESINIEADPTLPPSVMEIEVDGTALRLELGVDESGNVFGVAEDGTIMSLIEEEPGHFVIDLKDE